MLNLRKCPFLSAALDYIRKNPGCSKWEVVMEFPTYPNPYCAVPSRTLAYRYQALNRLIEHKMVENKGAPGQRYKLYALV